MRKTICPVKNEAFSRIFGLKALVFALKSRDFALLSRDFGLFSRDFGLMSRDFAMFSRDFGLFSRDFSSLSRDFDKKNGRHFKQWADQADIGSDVSRTDTVFFKKQCGGRDANRQSLEKERLLWI